MAPYGPRSRDQSFFIAGEGGAEDYGGNYIVIKGDCRKLTDSKGTIRIL